MKRRIIEHNSYDPPYILKDTLVDGRIQLSRRERETLLT